jgi:predicted Zn-dependent peptidase
MQSRRLRVLLPLLALLACKPPEATQQPPTGDAGGQAQRDPAAILAASDLPALLPSPLPDDTLGVTIHRLSNGLTVYISTDREEPSFNAWIAVRAGSRHDPAASTGLAHYLEHMMFKGTRQLGTLDYEAERPHLERIEALYGQLRATEDPAARAKIFAEIDAATQKTAATAIPNELDRTLSQLGISGVNAFTSDEMTVYISTVPKNRLDAWARIEAARFTDPVFRLFYPELEAVYEEKNISLDSPEERVWEAAMRGLFPAHPYGTQPTIGTSEHLKNPAYGDMVAYFRRWYVPNNVAIVLAGDIDADTALPALERAFGGWQPQPLSPPEPGQLTGPKGRDLREIVAEGEQSVTLGWRTAAHTHADEPALALMDMIVDNSVSGLVQTELLLPQKLPAAGSGGDTMREAGYWTLYGTARDGQALEEVESHLMAVVAKLKAGAFTDDDLAAIMLAHEIGEKYKQESIDGRIWPMASAFIDHRPWEQVVGRLARLRRVTREEIISAANRYLTDDRIVVYRQRGEHKPPAIPKPVITPVELDPSRRSPFASELLATPAAPLEPQRLRAGQDYQRHTIPAGPLYWAPNRRSDLFDLTYQWELGSRERPLLCHALDLLDAAGAGDLDAAALKRRFYQLGVDVSTRCTDDTVAITLRGLQSALTPAQELLDRWLRAPLFTEDTVKRLLDNTLSQRRDALEDPDFVAYALSLYASRGAKSPLLAAPSNAALQRATGKQLAAQLAALPDLAHTTLYFGPLSAEDAKAAVAFGRAHRPVPPRPPRSYRQVTAPTLFFAHKDTTQARVNLTFPQPPLPREQRPVADMLGRILGGDMSGIIFQEVREARGLAYSAYGAYRFGERPIDPSVLYGALGTQADKTLDALTLILQLLRDPPLSAERFEAARTAAIAEHRSDYIRARSRPYVAYTWDRRGEPEDPRAWEYTAVQALELAAVQGFAARFAAAPLIISVMGDKNRIELAALRRLATTVEEVPVTKMVSYGPFPKNNQP